MKSKTPIVLTIGVFDGVHRGHQALLARTVRLAKKLKARPEALSFHDHPMHVLKKGPRIPFLLPRRETFNLLRAKGAQKVHILRFTPAFSKKSPGQFVRWLCGLGKLKGIVVGENFRFGRGAQGDVALLEALGEEKGFEVKQFLPKDGVYACAVKLGHKLYRAGMNLGKRPTFQDDNHQRQAEVHLLHYYGKLYGKHMKVYLLQYLRPEKKFPSTQALVRQIQKDLVKVRRASLGGLK